MKGKDLHQKLRDIRDTLSRQHATRLHRAISWAEAADKYSADKDQAFLNLWIAFNSCYAVENDGAMISERRSFNIFIETLVSLDKEKKLYNTLWMNFSKFTRVVIDNQYVFEPFWASQRNGDELWKSSFESAKRAAYSALANNDVPVLLSIVFDRLYVLRNQLAHGGATYGSSINREQVTSGANFMSHIVPIIIDIMLTTGDETTDWGPISYPVIE